MSHPLVSRPLPLVAVAVATLLAAAPAHAFSQVVVFGDSLSDSGHTLSQIDLFPGGTCAGTLLYPEPPFASGSCTNGPTWVEGLAAGLGLAADPATAGGTNYAVGGATAIQDPLGPFPPSDPDGDYEDIADQLGRYLGMHAVDPNALYVIAAGTNDLQFTARGWMSPAGGAQDAVDAVMGVAATLAGLGAQNFLFSTALDVSIIPDASLTPLQRSDAASLAADFNAAIAAEVAGFSAGTAWLVDIDAVVQDVYTSPAAHGITNTTDACVTTGAFGATPDFGTACGLSPAIQATYFFIDEIHPTVVVHDAIAVAALATVPEPGLLALLLGPIAAHRLARRGFRRTGST